MPAFYRPRTLLADFDAAAAAGGYADTFLSFYFSLASLLCLLSLLSHVLRFRSYGGGLPLPQPPPGFGRPCSLASIFSLTRLFLQSVSTVLLVLS
jgi:hypothetical protein